MLGNIKLKQAYQKSKVNTFAYTRYIPIILAAFILLCMTG